MNKTTKIFIWSGSGSEHKICAYQSTKVYNFFDKNWYNILKSPKNADLIILNWYPFEELEESINLLTINYYLITYPKAQILLIWSMPWMMPYMKDVDRVDMIGQKDISDFDTQFEHTISINDSTVGGLRFFIPLSIDSLNLEWYGYINKNIESKYIYTEKDLLFSVDDFHKPYENKNIHEYDHEAYNYLEDISWEYPIQICTWCGWYCSFCNIRDVAGFVTSRPMDSIIIEIKQAVSLWFKEIHFIDEDSASYWLDIWIDFADLLNSVNKIDWDFKIKIFYFEPGRLEKLYSKIDPKTWKKVISFCVSLQTTSQRVLKLMNRHYNIKNVIDIVNKVKQDNQNITLTTQLIYWFPTETFDEFKDYFRLIRHFDILWFYYYSDRNGTKATKFLWKITKHEMIKRLLFLWKVKNKFIDRVFDKNESLEQWIAVFKKRLY